MKQKTEPEGWQSNHEGSADKALYSLSLSRRLLCSPRGPIYGTPRTRVLRFTLGGSFLAIVVPVRGLFRQGRGMLSQLQSFSLGYLPTYLPTSPPLAPFPRLYVPSSTCIRAKLSRPISLFSLSPLFFSSSEKEGEEKKWERESEKDRQGAGYLGRLIRLRYRKENHLT